jgi:hypothetical protein
MTLTEALIALALTLVVTTTALGLVVPASRAMAVQPDATDVQQRARVAAESIARELSTAGLGVYGGATPVELSGAIAVVLPRQLGVTGDGPDVARADAITILSVPATRAQTSLAAPVTPAHPTLSVEAAINCGGAALCGLTAGSDVLITDNDGHFDIFRLTTVTGATATLRLHGQLQAIDYPAGALVTEVTSRTFALDPATRIVRQYDGDASDQPAVDHITHLAFEYFGTDGLGGLTAIDRAAFTDGPWVGAGSTRFDADLLRVRMIRVRVRAEAAAPERRASVPEVTVTIDVAPRALGIAG